MDYLDYIIEDMMERLEYAAGSDDFYELSCMIVEDMAGLEDDIERYVLLEPTLRFIEEHPRLDFGRPGPLVHYVESFYGNDYEGLLVESVKRCPTPHTLLMLLRIINGEEEHKRMEWIELMQATALRDDIDPEIANIARRYLGCIDGRQGAET